MEVSRQFLVELAEVVREFLESNSNQSVCGSTAQRLSSSGLEMRAPLLSSYTRNHSTTQTKRSSNEHNVT